MPTPNDLSSPASADEVLLDAPLAPDPDADSELSSTGGELIRDESVSGSRWLLVRRDTAAIAGGGGSVTFVCTFQAASGCRFRYARVLLMLTTPEGVSIVSLTPKQTHAPSETVKAERKYSAKLEYGAAMAGAELARSREFAIGRCLVTGSGEGTAVAQWEFIEDESRRQGLGLEHALSITLPVRGRLTATISVAAELVRAGFPGTVDALRHLILGPNLPIAGRTITFEIPLDDPPNSLRLVKNP